MDGVLVDSEPVYMQRFLRFMQEHGVALDQKAYRKTVGWSSQMTWEWALSHWPEEITVSQLQAKYRAYWKGQPVRYDEVLDQDVLPVLNQLHALKIKTALASSSPRAAIDQMLKQCHLTDEFDAIVSGEASRTHKSTVIRHRCSMFRVLPVWLLKIQRWGSPQPVPPGCSCWQSGIPASTLTSPRPMRQSAG